MSGTMTGAEWWNLTEEESPRPLPPRPPHRLRQPRLPQAHRLRPSQGPRPLRRPLPGPPHLPLLPPRDSRGLSLFRGTPNTIPASISQTAFALSQHVEALVAPRVEQPAVVLRHLERRLPLRFEPRGVGGGAGSAGFVEELRGGGLAEANGLVTDVAGGVGKVQHS
ncbi:hypothetical protein Fmac_030788 [Flemingia macrophylla]|uniref:Uncharacterized protein n=1 Tax=Flemingia macrophylla TaxID=520843 RepID=A0ABD1L092_9FABA